MITIKQRPAEGRVLDAALEARQEAAVAAADAAPEGLAAAQRAGGAANYESAFPNVGLVLWQAGFVLAEWLIRARPLASSLCSGSGSGGGGGDGGGGGKGDNDGGGGWRGAAVLELGCGVGQLGIPLACTGARVTMTDLPHVVGLTAENAALNAHATPIAPRVMPFVWGEDAGVLGYGGADSSGADGGGDNSGGGSAGGNQQQQQQQQHQGPLDLVVAADVLYEPQYYGALLDALVAACRLGGGRASGWRGAGAAAAAAGGEGGAAAAGGEGGAAAAAAGETGAPSAAAAAAAPPRALPLCFLCYRRRRYKEDAFEALARARGFAAVEEVPSGALHPEYREGYRLIELVHDGVLRAAGGGAAAAGSAAAASGTAAQPGEAGKDGGGV